MTEHIEDLFPFYALDALTDEEKQQVDNYLKENPEAEARLQVFIDSAELLPFENEPFAPSITVKNALMARVKEDSKSMQPSKQQKSDWQRLWDALFSRTAPAIFAPAIPILLGFLIFAMARNNGAIRQLNNTIAKQQNTITELQTDLENQEIALSIYTAVNAQTIIVESTGLQANPVGKLTFDPDSGRAILDVIALLDDPETVYQLWFIQGETPISAGVFDVDASGSEQFVVDTAVPASFDAIGVSIEPPGGSEQPTGDIILLGTGS